MSRAIIVLCFIISIFSSVAFASDWEDLSEMLGAVAQTWVTDQAGQWVDRELNNEQAILPAPVGRLGVVRVVMGDRGGWYGRSDTLSLARQTLSSVGFQVVDETARKVAVEEKEKLGGYAGLEPAYFVATISLWQGKGGWLDTEVRRAFSRFGIERETVYAHLVMQVSRGGIIVASTEVEASDNAVSLDARYGGVRFRTEHPNRQDLAVLAACQQAANDIARQLAPTTDWRYDPQTGELISPAPAGWRFDPYTGQPIDQPAPNTFNPDDFVW